MATAKLTKKSISTPRFIVASFIGGVYSFILLLSLPQPAVALSRLVAAALIVLVAFKIKSLKSFAATVFIFFAVNFAFLGVIYGFALMTKTPYIHFSNGAVYVNIGSRELLLSAFIAYVVSCVVMRFYNRKLASGEIYSLTVENGGTAVHMYAFSDTGNKLREPFSDYPVIVADATKVEGLVTPEKTRIVPAGTVNKSAFLVAFSPDRVTVKTNRGETEIENVYIALSDEINNDAFSAIINPEILSV